MNEEKEVNRKIKLKYVDIDGTAGVYESRIKYISPDSIEILAPIEIDNINSLVDQDVTIDEVTIGKKIVSHNTVVERSSKELLKTTGEKLIVLKRPITLRIREFARVNVNFPVTVSVLSSENSTETKEDEDLPFYEALSVNISAVGILFVLGFEKRTIIRQGQDVILNFKLMNKKRKETIEFENISAKIVRVYNLEVGDLSQKHTIAAEFSNMTKEQQDQIMHYVLERQIDFRYKEIVDIGPSPVYEQLTLLKDEVKRLQQQLLMTHEQIKLAEEARQRSDNIIVQLTKRLSLIQRAPTSRRHKWWKFWEWF